MTDGYSGFRSLQKLGIGLSALLLIQIGIPTLINNFFSRDSTYAGPAEQALISNYFSSGNEYTKYWSSPGACSGQISDVTGVIYLTPGTGTIPSALSGNTLYVLQPGTYVSTGQTLLTGSCIGVVATGTVTIDYQTGGATFLVSGASNSIFNNIRFIKSGPTDLTNSCLDSNDKSFCISYSNNITLKNLTIRKFSHGVYGYQSSRIFMENSFFSDIQFTAIDINESVNSFFNKVSSSIASISLSFRNSTGNKLTNFAFYGSSQGILNSDSTKSSFINGVISNNADSAIRDDSSNNSTYNNIIANYSEFAGFTTYGSSGTIVNNSLFSNNHYGIYATNAATGILFNNSVIANNTTGLSVSNNSLVTFYGTSQFFGNDSDISTSFGGQYTTGGISGIFSTGALSTGQYQMSCRWSVNPINGSGDILDDSSLCTTKNFISGWTGDENTKLIFGENIPKQSRPIIYSGTSIIYTGTNGIDYQSGMFIGDFSEIGGFITFSGGIYDLTSGVRYFYSPTSPNTLVSAVTFNASQAVIDEINNYDSLFTISGDLTPNPTAGAGSSFGQIAISTSNTGEKSWYLQHYVNNGFSSFGFSNFYRFMPILRDGPGLTGSFIFTTGVTSFNTFYFTSGLSVGVYLTSSIASNFEMSGAMAGVINGVINTTTGYMISLTAGDGGKQIKMLLTTGVFSAFAPIMTVFLDTTAPTQPTQTYPVNNTGASQFTTLQWSSSTDVTVGLSGYEYEVFSGASSIASGLTSSGITSQNLVLGSGVYSWTIRSFDRLGNFSAWSPLTGFFVNSGILGGTISFVGGSSSSGTSQSVNLLATETANFTLNGSDMVGSLSNIATTNTTTRPVTLTAGDGWKVINVVYSTGTKISQSYPAFIYLDQTAPGGGSFLINNGASSTTSQSVTLTITCPYDISSPVKVSFGESASPSNFTSCGSSINMSLSAGNGLKTVYLRFTDNLGNQTTDLTQTITLNASIVTPPNPGGGGGGGGGGGITPDVCPGGDFSPSYYDRTCGTNPNNNNPINPNPGNSTDVYTNYSSTDGFIPTGTTPYERLRSIILRYKLLRMPYKDRPYNKIIFGDIANDSNNLAIKTLKNYGIIQGYGASNFKPNTQITYAEFLKILVRTSNTPATYTPREGFDNKWYQIYLDKAKRDGWLDKSVTNPHAAITERALLGFIKKSFEVMGRTFSIPQSTIDQAQGTVSRSELTKIVTALFMLSYRDSAITAGNNTPLLERLAEIIKNDTPQVQFNKIWELVQRLNGINASVLWKNYAVDKQFLIEDLLKTIPRT